MTAPDETQMAHCRDCSHRLGSGCGCECCAWAGEAVRAATEAVHRLTCAETSRGLPCPHVLPWPTDAAAARAAVLAALPVVRAAAVAAEREASQQRANAAMERFSQTAAAAQAKAIEMAVAAERERIIALAEQHDARYRRPVYTPVDTLPPTVNLSVAFAPFADLLRGTGD